MNQSSRSVAQVITPEPVVEGAGVHLRRSIGTRGLDHLDPFLLLDHFESIDPADYQPGFPYHPHRGIETVTVVRKGEVRHGDSLGHRGTIAAGDIQWMTSGSGIMHEEMPQVRPEGIAGLQLWLNLPAREKMGRPKYRDLQADRLTETETDEGARVRVIAGEAAGGRLVGPVEGLAVAPKFIDVTLPAGATFHEAVPRGHTVFAYVDHGEVRFGPEHTRASAPALVVFGDGDVVEASAGAGGGRFLLAAARPLHEPIARYGPFVMNTRAEIEQTLEELRTGRFIRAEPPLSS
jgi:quercetin 2,3-dioxygenase